MENIYLKIAAIIALLIAGPTGVYGFLVAIFNDIGSKEMRDEGVSKMLTSLILIIVSSYIILKK